VAVTTEDPHQGDSGVALVAPLAGTGQCVVLESEARRTIERYRQLKGDASEAGGQLFGAVTLSDLRVVAASGPYDGDNRGKFEYRSEPGAAQAEIERQFARGLLYLGEWHTHPEEVPVASSRDVATARSLWRCSRLNTNALVMIIAGRAPRAEGLALYRFDAGSLTRVAWQDR